ncbi:MAG: hypothetical protein AB2598_12010 [Candidatus Thiodiazotropha sp.]
MPTGPVLILIAALIPTTTWAICQQSAEIRLFFDRLNGAWQGKAMTTPIGPRPYDINFIQRGPFRIYGQANPGAAIHHWDFYCDNERFKLRFLSTFAGNREPLLLEAVRISGTRIDFKAKDPDFLELIVRMGEDHSVFEVLHAGERHVLIELQR